MAKYHHYRVSIRGVDGDLPTVFRGHVHSTSKETDQHVRGRIMLDIMSRAEFNWTTVDPSLVDNIVKTAA